jgi:hypothetical protein
MARHHTKDKGDLAVAKVQADLIERGATVLMPFTEHAPFDLIAYIDELFFRIQVKFRSSLCGSVKVVFESSWADRHGTHKRPMPRNEVDVVAIYCPETRYCYYVDPSRFGRSVTLRVEPARNGQAAGVFPAADFLQMPPPTSNGVAPGHRGRR